MKILVLGGTQFVGRHFVEAALESGHSVTLLNRGKTEPGLFPQVPRITGDRNDPEVLARIPYHEFDAIVDVNAYFPRQIRALREAAGSWAGHYQLVSTISTYGENIPLGAREDAPKATLEDRETEELNGETYGGLKVACEEEAMCFGGMVSIIRPTMVIGPWDHTDRFTWFVAQALKRDRVPVWDRLDQPVQWIDARDLATFMLHRLGKIGGVWHTVSDSVKLSEFLELVAKGVGKPVEWVPISAEKHPESGWHFMLPQDGIRDGIFALSNQAATDAGLKVRTLTSSARDTAKWWQSQNRELKTEPNDANIDELLA